jgi:hypothetical protein
MVPFQPEGVPLCEIRLNIAEQPRATGFRKATEVDMVIANTKRFAVEKHLSYGKRFPCGRN